MSIRIPCWSYWYYEDEEYREIFQVVPLNYDRDEDKELDYDRGGIYCRTIWATEYDKEDERCATAVGFTEYFSKNAFEEVNDNVVRGRLLKDDIPFYILNRTME